MIIRPATKADMAAVDMLLARTYPKLLKADYPPSVLVTALPIISRARPELLASGTYYVAEDAEGQIEGAGGWTRDRRDRRLGHVRHVVTDYRALRRGIGRALMERCFADASAVGITRLECWATRTAVPFYTAMGFETLGPMEVELRGGISFLSVRMMRAL